MFKNVKNLIQPSTFSNTNNYLLQNSRFTLNPSAQFFKPDQVKQNYTPFETSMLALAFSNKTNTLKQLLSQAEGNKFSSFRKEAEQEMIISQELTTFFIDLSYQNLKLGLDVPVKGFTSFLLACVQQNKVDSQFMEQYVLPQITNKLNWLDREGCQDLLEALPRISAKKELVTALINYFDYDSQQFQPCELHAWNCDQYILGQKQEIQDIYELFFNDLKNGTFLAHQKHQFRQMMQVVKIRFLNRLFFREHRIITEFVQTQRKNNNLTLEEAKKNLLI